MVRWSFASSAGQIAPFETARINKADEVENGVSACLVAKLNDKIVGIRGGAGHVGSPIDLLPIKFTARLSPFFQGH